MKDATASRVELASKAREDDIPLHLQDPAPEVVRALLQNPHLTEEHLTILAGRKNLPSEMLETIFQNKQSADSYRVKLALAKNPKTPLFTALSIAKYLRLFDLADLARNHQLPVLYRRKLAAMVVEKIPTLPLGVKKTLAKIAAGDILFALLQDGYPEVVRTCLGNPHLVEANLYKVINRRTTTASTIRTISEDRTWCCRYQIKFALIRNEHTPLGRTVVFLSDIKLYDLIELYRDPLLPAPVRPAVHRELLERGKDPDNLRVPEEAEVYEIDESDESPSDACSTDE